MRVAIRVRFYSYFMGKPIETTCKQRALITQMGPDAAAPASYGGK